MAAEPHLRDTLKPLLVTLRCNRCGKSVMVYEGANNPEQLEAGYAGLTSHLDTEHVGWRDQQQI